MRVLVFGADGGGSKTIGLIADQTGAIFAQRTAGATNPNVVGMDTAAATVAELVSACCEQAACRVQDLRSAVLGLAGASRDAVRERLRDQIRTRLGEAFPLRIETDARIALEGAFAGKPGAVIIAGTGSVGIAKGESGETAMVGGWGKLLGDEGSGYVLGREALKVLAACYDGRAREGTLTNVLREEAGLHSRERILELVYGEGLDVARLAPYVIRAAGQNDEAALSILTSGARELTALLAALISRMNMKGRIPVAFSGGLLQQESIYLQILQRLIHEQLPGVEVVSPAHPAAYGAVLMALHELDDTTQTTTHFQHIKR